MFLSNRGVMLVALLLGTVSLPVVADGPAVSGVNGKVSIQGGQMKGKGASSADAVLSLPVGHSFGVQIDGSIGDFLGSSYSGVGGHFFWRDPSRGLVGLVGANQRLGGTDSQRYGAEGEAYLNNFTLGVRLGQQEGDIPHGNYSGVGARWYANENFVVNAGFDHSPGGTDTTGIGMEWQPTTWGVPGLSVFARASRSTGAFGANAATIGVRYYLDESRSLIQRHRTQDPESVVMPLGDFSPTPLPSQQMCMLTGPHDASTCQCTMGSIRIGDTCRSLG
jgi:hypothetical protein